MHFIVRFEPKTGCDSTVRRALKRVEALSRAEPGCRRFQLFESLQEPTVFAIHSEWVGEAAFELHASLPHTRAFLAEVAPLLTHQVCGLRLRALTTDGADTP